MDDSRTVWCGNLSDKVTEELLFELFLQVGPLERVKIPTDKSGKKLNYGFVTFKHEMSTDYALRLLNGTSLFDRKINIKYRNNRNPNEGTVGQNDQSHNKFPTASEGLRTHSSSSPKPRHWNDSYIEHDNRHHDRHSPYERSPNQRNESNSRKYRRDLNNRRHNRSWY